QEPEKPISLKRPADARDAREVARKLIKSGAIPAIQKQQTKQDQTSFKRPKGQERKRIPSEAGVSSYQPFSSTQNDVAQEFLINEMIKEEPVRGPNLYQKYSTEREKDEKVDKKTSSSCRQYNKPRAGNTIFVSGNKVNEEFLKKHFSNFGSIVNVSMEIEKW
uniref:Negative elongation factor E n=1 Tax=Megaselia scalaris TaxID=36166 RepID=T1H6L7_MEGSC